MVSYFTVSLKWSYIPLALPVIITCRTGAKRLPAGCRYCLYSRADFSVFHPAGATCCTYQGESCQGEADHSLVTGGVESYSCKDRQCLFLTSLTQTRKFQLRNYVHVLGAPSIINCLQRPTLNWLNFVSLCCIEAEAGVPYGTRIMWQAVKQTCKCTSIHNDQNYICRLFSWSTDVTSLT